MKVYVLEMGCYESRAVCGVYASPEAAQAVVDPTNWTEYHDDFWHSWDNDEDWDRAASITEYEMDE